MAAPTTPPRSRGEFEGVTVLEMPQPSKTAALNAGDAAASHWPRLYLDADVQISPGTVGDVLSALASGHVLAARPAVRFDLQDAHPLIHSYYRTRLQLPTTRSGLWGGGVYGLSQEGRQRFQQFPDLIADDLFVDRLFEPGGKSRPGRVPCGGLPAADAQGPSGRPASGLSRQRRTARPARALPVTRCPRSSAPFAARLSAGNALVYVGFALAGRRGKARPGAWERDASTRQPAEGGEPC